MTEKLSGSQLRSGQLQGGNFRASVPHVKVSVPATSGNVGPGFDCLGLAYQIYDDVIVSLVTDSTEVTVFGEGAGTVPLGEDHLVVQAFRRAVTELGLPQPNLSMQCHNRIPHGQGLGSSAAAVVAGILAARALLADEQKFPDRQVLQLGAEFEGHPDNAAPALYGGPVVAWRENLEYQALPLKLSPKVKATLLVPETVLATKTARAALPGEVPHRDAAFNVSRAALLVAALAEHPELLLPATADKLHQDYRAHAMPASAALLDQLRALGVPALISGAGPTVLVLGSLDYSGTIAKLLQTSDFGTWRVLQPGLDRKGAIVTRLFPN